MDETENKRRFLEFTKWWILVTKLMCVAAAAAIVYTCVYSGFTIGQFAICATILCSYLTLTVVYLTEAYGVAYDLVYPWEDQDTDEETEDERS